MDLAKVERIITDAESRRGMLQESLVAMEETLAGLRVREADLQLATVLIQETAKETQDRLRIHVQDLVQSALSSVFPGVYDFRLVFTPRRGRTEVDIFLDKDGAQINPMDSSGGGVVDVVSFALRVVSWSISGTEPTLIFDEPLKWVSRNLRPRCAELMSELSRRLGIQMIFVTHDEELVQVADRVIIVDQKRRRSFVTIREGTKDEQ